MSEFLRHAPCRECGSKDNLGIYTDHEHCFGCGYTKHYNPLERRRSGVETKPIRTLYLPDDIVSTIPYEAHEWIKKYGLTQRELLDNKVVWSDSQKLLIFLYVQNELLLGWQGRYFGPSKEKSKWWNQGNLRELSTIYGTSYLKNTRSLILVEDVVSAIKIGRQFPCKPLYGSYIDITNIYKLYKKNNLTTIYIWLDDDKYKEAHKYAIKLSSLGIKCKVIRTKEDPKVYNNEDIGSIISTHHQENQHQSQITNHPIAA